MRIRPLHLQRARLHGLQKRLRHVQRAGAPVQADRLRHDLPRGVRRRRAAPIRRAAPGPERVAPYQRRPSPHHQLDPPVDFLERPGERLHGVQPRVRRGRRAFRPLRGGGEDRPGPPLDRRGVRGVPGGRPGRYGERQGQDAHHREPDPGRRQRDLDRHEQDAAEGQGGSYLGRARSLRGRHREEAPRGKALGCPAVQPGDHQQRPRGDRRLRPGAALSGLEPVHGGAERLQSLRGTGEKGRRGVPEAQGGRLGGTP